MERRLFLAMAAGVTEQLLTGCGTLFDTSARMPGPEQQRDDMSALVRDLVSRKYNLRELRLDPLKGVEVTGFAEFEREAVIGNPLILTTTTNYGSPGRGRSQVRISGGLYQPEAKAVFQFLTANDERIPNDKLPEVARALLDIPVDTNGQLTTEKFIEVAYPWGQIGGIEFNGTTEQGRQFAGYFDAKGQGLFDVK